MLQNYHIRTAGRSQLVDITPQVCAAVRAAGVTGGVAVVYCPHTTAGITVNEGADPAVSRDILMRLDELYPWEHSLYRHGEGNSAAHLKASAVGASQVIPVADGELLLGTWQAIYFCEFDGPRERTFQVKVLSD